MFYCEKCGNKIDQQDKFCEKCGFLVSNDKYDNKLKEDDNLENKAWYRLLKVLYAIAFAVGIFITIFISISTIPKKFIDSEFSTIKCANGKIYPLRANNLYLSLDNSQLFSNEDKNARILCSLGTNDYYAYSKVVIKDKNYILNAVYNTPNYISWLIYSLLSLFAVWVALKMLKIGVLYIAIGKKPNWKNEFLQQWT